MKRGNVKQLLINDAGPRWRWMVEDRGIRWVTDRYVLARAEVFRTPPKTEGKDVTAQQIRAFLESVRCKPSLGMPKDARHRIQGRAEAAMLLLPGNLYIAVNARCWDAWSATGLDPEVSGGGHLLWFGKVRGKRALFGVVQPMRLGPNVGGAS